VPKISTVWVTSTKPCAPAVASAQRSTSAPDTSTAVPQGRPAYTGILAPDQRQAERLSRTLLEERTFARPACTSETERRAAFGPWLHTCNHHRGHTGLGGHPPASRVPDLSGQNT